MSRGNTRCRTCKHWGADMICGNNASDAAGYQTAATFGCGAWEVVDLDGETAYRILLQSRSGGRLAAARAALDRAFQQTEAIKAHLTAARLALPQAELLKGVRLPETPKPSKATRDAYDTIMREAEYHETMRRIGEQAERYQREIESTKQEVELARKRAPIIAVDFDGTLCENAWPDIGETKWATVQALLAAQAAGARLILWTNRVGARLAEAVEWCRNRELEFDAVNENLPEVRAAFTTDCRKVCADIYLDDKAAQPSAMVLGQLWETARETMNETAAAEAAKKTETKTEGGNEQ